MAVMAMITWLPEQALRLLMVALVTIVWELEMVAIRRV
jgi:hypothetical protein